MFDFLSRKFSDILERITGGATLTEQNIAQALESVKESLLEADVPYDLVHKFVDAVAAEAVGKKVLSKVKPGEQFVKIVYEQLLAFMVRQHPLPRWFVLCKKKLKKEGKNVIY
jgi:signal recognition particle subunit SRP54